MPQISKPEYRSTLSYRRPPLPIPTHGKLSNLVAKIDDQFELVNFDGYLPKAEMLLYARERGAAFPILIEYHSISPDLDLPVDTEKLMIAANGDVFENRK